MSVLRCRYLDYTDIPLQVSFQLSELYLLRSCVKATERHLVVFLNAEGSLPFNTVTYPCKI
jgi:hypothetical protein